MHKGIRIFILLLTLGLAALPVVRAGQAISPEDRAVEIKTPVFRSVSPAEGKSLIEGRSGLLVVDVRGQDELTEGKIDGSLLAPVWDIARGRVSIPRERPLLVICAVGGRSYTVAKYLAAQGYPEVYNLEGGIAAWKKAGLPLSY